MNPVTPVETAVEAEALHWRGSEGALAATRLVPQEVAVGIAYDSRPYVVVMGTPGDLVDLAVGFTVTERIAAFADIEKVTVAQTNEGLLADVLLSPNAAKAHALTRRRTLEARSSCGLCGIEDLKAAVRPPAMVGEGLKLSHSAIQRALAALEEGQDLGRRTRATHAAAWADAAGGVLLVREDVGRHNALDKLVGAALARGLSTSDAFILITSRCSYEMVDKAAASGVQALVAISAPTALAIKQAQAAGLTLVALARRDGHAVFSRSDRLVP